MRSRTARGVVLAVQFLTRIPTPQVRRFDDEELARSAVFHPLVGVIIGGLVVLPLWLLGGLGSEVLAPRPWPAAAVALLVWVWVTGALHLDGLSDVTDGLGAAHRDPARFLTVLKDPHVGSFGVVTLVCQLLLKLVLLAELGASTVPWAAVLLVPAWARWGSLWLSWRVPLLQATGLAERFAWRLGPVPVLGWAAVLAALTLWVSPWLLLALVLVPLAEVFWRRRLGGINGDCLGASIEVTESVLLLALVASTWA